MEQAPWWAAALLTLGGAVVGAVATYLQQRASEMRQAKERTKERAEEREWSRRAEMRAALHELRIAVDEIDAEHITHALRTGNDPESSMTQAWAELDPKTLAEAINKIRGLALEIGHPALRAAFVDQIDLDAPKQLYAAIYDAHADLNTPPVDNS